MSIERGINLDLVSKRLRIQLLRQFGDRIPPQHLAQAPVHLARNIREKFLHLDSERMSTRRILDPVEERAAYLKRAVQVHKGNRFWCFLKPVAAVAAFACLKDSFPREHRQNPPHQRGFRLQIFCDFDARIRLGIFFGQNDQSLHRKAEPFGIIVSRGFICHLIISFRVRSYACPHVPELYREPV